MQNPSASEKFAALATYIAAPAFAQVSEPLPRFEALEQQQQMNEQHQLDTLEANRQRDLNRSALPNSGVSTAQRALVDQQYDRQRDLLLQDMANTRAREQRERDLANAALSNTRVPASSTLVVTDPERYLLPPSSAGQYYARVDGRFVLVDRMSELVVGALRLGHGLARVHEQVQNHLPEAGRRAEHRGHGLDFADDARALLDVA